MVRPFCGFPIIDDLLSSTYVLITQSHSCIRSFWTILHCCYNVFWTPLQMFHSKRKLLLDVTDVALDTRHWVGHLWFNGQFGFNLQLHLQLSFALLSTLGLCCFMMFSTLVQWYNNNSALKCFSWTFYGICCSWGSASSKAWWAAYQYLFSHFGYTVVWTI